MINVFPSDILSPQQALLQAEEELENMEYVAIVYTLKGEDLPRLTCSSQSPMELSFLGTAIQHYALGHLRE